MSRMTLVVGFPGTGKSSYVKKNLGDGLVFDLDNIAMSLIYEEPHAINDVPLMKLANSFLAPFSMIAPSLGRPIFVIRAAPKLDILDDFKFDEIVYMTHQYDVTSRADAHEYDKQEMNQRLIDLFAEAARRGIPVRMEK